MGKKRGSGVGAYIGLALSVAFVVACGLVFRLASTGELRDAVFGLVGAQAAQGEAEEAGGETAEAPVPKDFSAYSWEEVAQIARLISSAESDGEARSLGMSYGVLTADGNITDSVRTLQLADGSLITCRVVGLRADEAADGSGKAGLTFLSYGYGAASMNAEATAGGGWEASGMRSWLAGDVLALLPAEVSGSVKAVSKLTNNQGASCDPGSAVTPTSDSLWLFSGAEVYGRLTWLSQEYGDTPIANADYVDFVALDAMLSSEGSQYQYFAERGAADRSEFSCVPAVVGSQAGNWWLRSCYPVQGTSSDEGYFYQVLRSGYPSTTIAANGSGGVVVGFCL